MEKFNLDNFNNKLYLALFLATIFKIFVIFYLPPIEDEIYYINYGKSLVLGFYEHPPIVAWVAWLLSFISLDYHFVRLVIMVLSLGLAYILYKLAIFLSEDREKSLIITTLFFLSIFNIGLLFPLLTDTFLIFFGLLSIYYFIHFIKLEKNIHLLLSAIFFSLAVLSKFLIIPIFLSYILIVAVEKRYLLIKFLFIFLSIGIFFSIPLLYWNYNNCWANLMMLTKGGNPFNLVSAIKNELVLMIDFIVILNPVSFYFLLKYFKNILKQQKILLLLLSIPILFFIIGSFTKQVGLHWILVYTFPMFIMLTVISIEELRLLFYVSCWILLFIAVIVSIFLLTLTYKTDFIDYVPIKYKGYYSMTINADQVCPLINDLQKKSDYQFSEIGYGAKTLIDYACGTNVLRLFSSQIHARGTDSFPHHTLNHKNIAMLLYRTNETELEFLGSFFNNGYTTKDFYIGKIKYTLFLGNDLNTQKYEDDFIIPRVLPMYEKNPLKFGVCYYSELLGWN